MLTDLAARFPKLQSSGYRRTSPPTIDYNCIAWAAGESHQWWEPDPYNIMYWPDSAPRKTTMKAYIAAFETRGYSRCKDGNLESGFEKIALYAKGGVPQHAARQLDDGTWTSKLGPQDDITHSSLESIEGDEYGSPAVFMHREKPTA